MTASSEIGWGSYSSWEGPFYRGKHPFKLPANPTREDKIIAVVAATEGGHYDSYNGYDRGISSSGLIQYIESGQYSVSDMLGSVANIDRNLIAAVDKCCDEHSVMFKKNAKGNWRFFFMDSRGEIDRVEEQQQQFFLASTGKKGTWDSTSKQYAKEWAAAICTVWESERAQNIQRAYIAVRIRGFALPYARKLLNIAPGDAIGSAFTAAYLSFAVNNPTWANKHLQLVAEDGKYEMWTRDWLIHVLKQLTFGPKVTIYPHRYKAIRPVLEKLYGLDLPDLADELEQWKGAQGHELFYDTKEIQEALLALGFDLGPAGADDVYGEKTTNAVLLFEQLDYEEINKVPKEHVDGMFDDWTAKKMAEVLEVRGLEQLSVG